MVRGFRSISFGRIARSFRRAFYGQDYPRSGGLRSDRFNKEKFERFTKRIEDETEMPRRWIDLYGACTFAGTALYNSWKCARKVTTKVRTALRPADPLAPIDASADTCPNPFVRGD